MRALSAKKKRNERARASRGARLGLLGLLLTLALPLGAQRGGITIRRDLAELVENAGTIVRGHVVSARVEPHPTYTNLQTVVVTVKVKETLKGEAGASFTFRQYIWDIRDRYDAAGYRKGGEVLLFLTPASAIGLSSPVGLGQGRFRVVQDKEKQELVVNEVGNQGLLEGVQSALESRGERVSPAVEKLLKSYRGGPLGWEEMRELVKRLAGTN